MTGQPSPSWGSGPPSEDVAAPHPGAWRGGGAVVANPPRHAFTPWSRRVVAWLIDYAVCYAIPTAGFIALVATRETVCVADDSAYAMGDVCSTGNTTAGLICLAVSLLLAVVFFAWNFGRRQGVTGSSVGKSLLGFRVVNQNSWQPVGFAASLGRELVYLVAYWALGILWLAAVLFPLWDHRRQTLVDKLVKTVAIPR